MTTITTYNGITLGLVEVPKDAMGIELISRLNSVIINEEHNDLWYYTKTSDDMIYVELPKNYYELIGTTSTLTDEGVEPFVERETQYLYKNYKNNLGVCINALDSWNAFLKYNGIDLSKNWVVLKLLNNEEHHRTNID
jgi:rRNA pseudouridine-1189 N-methylase Emg1 (Nep1/Mra1 family)